MATTEILPNFYRINLPIPRGGFESFLDGWLIDDKERAQTVMIETGPASAVPGLLRQLEAHGNDKIDYLLYTHVHLDHSGGAGQFIAAHPEAKVLAPERGRPHLIDPSKLIAGSRTSLGSLCDVYGTPPPLPTENLVTGGVPGLTVIDTPGHAPHHSSYIYELGGKRILFAGEASGCWFRLDDGSYFMRPATPHKFFYDSAIASLDKLRALKGIDIVCFPHSGYLEDAGEVFDTAKKQMELWLEILSALPAGAAPEEAVRALKENDPVLAKLTQMPETVRRREDFFLGQSAKGYLGWIEMVNRRLYAPSAS